MNTNKIDLIKAEVARMHNLLPVMDGDNIYVNYADRICTTLEMYIDSLQEEPIFHVGNTIRHKKENDSFKVLAIEDDCYKLENNIVVSIAAQDSWELVEEPVSEDLKNAAKYYSIIDGADDAEEYARYDIKEYNAFKAGANWQRKQDQETIEVAEDHAMLAGMEKIKEQIMKDSLEREVKVDAGGYPYIPQMELYDYDKDIPLAKEGDRYKVILIKED